MSDLLAAPATPAPVLPRTGRLRPLPLTSAPVTGGFWAEVQQRNRDAVIPHCIASLEGVGWVENFRAAARGTLPQDRVGRLFTDSEVYKVLEALAWEDARRPDPALRAQVEAWTPLLAAAQADDGYLDTYYGYEGGPARYTDHEWGHELYCAGHLLQAAVAAIRTGGDRRLVDVARAVADHVCREFAEGAREALDGHPEVETALVELARATGEERYLEQARLFVERRGRRTLADTMFRGRDYYQDDVPVRDAEVLVGHAVRALYLAAGAVDVAVETGDEGLLRAVQRQYDRTLARRTYLTGGMGSNHHGETFGDDFELPSERAYAETCAAVASVHLAWRLMLATGEERYADVVERTLYNAVLPCLADDGRSFFYVNALQRRAPGTEPEPGGPSLRRTDGRRAAWFTTSCCPTNIARLLSSLGGYLATTDEEGVQLHQYATGRVEAELPGGRAVSLGVETGYPVDGDITVRVEATDDGPWSLGLRVPAWAAGAELEVDGDRRAVAPGLVRTARSWTVGDVVRLHLPVAPRFVRADPRVDAVRGCVAVERGPLVYAAESVDSPDVDLDLVAVDTAVAPRDGGRARGLDRPLPVTVSARTRTATTSATAWPYGEVDVVGGEPRELVLVPYHRWANREPSVMRVWLPGA